MLGGRPAVPVYRRRGALRSSPVARDKAGQASALESLGTERASCYVVNPINTTNLIEPLSHVAKGMPIVNVDSPVDQEAAKALGVQITV